MQVDETSALAALRTFLQENAERSFTPCESPHTKNCILAQFFDHFDQPYKHSVSHIYVNRVALNDYITLSGGHEFRSPVFSAIVDAHDNADSHQQYFTGADALRIMEQHNA